MKKTPIPVYWHSMSEANRMAKEAVRKVGSKLYCQWHVSSPRHSHWNWTNHYTSKVSFLRPRAENGFPVTLNVTADESSRAFIMLANICSQSNDVSPRAAMKYEKSSRSVFPGRGKFAPSLIVISLATCCKCKSILQTLSRRQKMSKIIIRIPHLDSEISRERKIKKNSKALLHWFFSF